MHEAIPSSGKQKSSLLPYVFYAATAISSLLNVDTAIAKRGTDYRSAEQEIGKHEQQELGDVITIKAREKLRTIFIIIVGGMQNNVPVQMQDAAVPLRPGEILKIPHQNK